MMLQATTIVMGNPVVGNNSYSGVAVFGIAASGLVGNPVIASAVWYTNDGWLTGVVNISYFDGSGSFMYAEQTNITLEAERAFETDYETCLYYPPSQGFFDGKFSIGLGTADKFSFYVCGSFESPFATFNGQVYGAVNVDVPIFGQKYLQYFLNMSGYFVEVYNRRFYYGFISFSYVLDGTSGTCETSSLFIPSPKYSPIVLVVTNSSTLGTIAGFTILTQPSQTTPNSAFIFGAPNSTLSQSRFCVTGPEYLEECLLINPYPSSTVEVSSTTKQQLPSMTVEAHQTSNEEVTQLTTHETGSTSTSHTSITSDSPVWLLQTALFLLITVAAF